MTESFIARRGRLVRAGYRRQVSDGNYGTEAAEVSLDWYVDDDDTSRNDEESAREMLAHAHTIVNDQLARSTSRAVRTAVTPRENVVTPRENVVTPRETAPPQPAFGAAPAANAKDYTTAYTPGPGRKDDEDLPF